MNLQAKQSVFCGRGHNLKYYPMPVSQILFKQLEIKNKKVELKEAKKKKKVMQSPSFRKALAKRIQQRDMQQALQEDIKNTKIKPTKKGFINKIRSVFTGKGRS